MATHNSRPFTPQPLTGGHEAEVLSFLSARPIHTVIMAGLIRDNGLVSQLNRGSFFAYRNREGSLEGVALIGEITLLEARAEAALAAFARLAQGHPNIHMVMGEREKIGAFWRHYAGAGQAPRLFCREMLFELRWPVGVRAPVPGLRTATPDDLEAVVAVHAGMALAESGVNPLEVDPEGFRRRCARRVEQGRVWVWADGKRVIFKADVISETSEVIYLEGLYVNPEERGRGNGLRCLSQLSRELLARARSLCLLVNEQNREAQALYRRCNFQLRGSYDTIFLQRAG
jgi:GNAT superfamily N-acetyltransferase